MPNYGTNAELRGGPLDGARVQLSPDSVQADGSLLLERTITDYPQGQGVMDFLATGVWPDGGGKVRWVKLVYIHTKTKYVDKGPEGLEESDIFEFVRYG